MGILGSAPPAIIGLRWTPRNGGAHQNHQTRDTHRDGPHTAPFDCPAAVRRCNGHVAAGGGFSGASRLSCHRIESRLDRELFLMQLVVRRRLLVGPGRCSAGDRRPGGVTRGQGHTDENTRAAPATRAPTIAKYQRRLMRAERTYRSRAVGQKRQPLLTIVASVMPDNPSAREQRWPMRCRNHDSEGPSRTHSAETRTGLSWAGQPGQFFAALQQQPYNSGAASPGTYAQAVQQSAYPDRHDQAFPQAVALYNQLTRGD